MGSVLDSLTEYAVSMTVEPNLHERARLALADALVAMLSGRTLPAGRSCSAYVKARATYTKGTVREFATLSTISEQDAAFVNGTLGHSDETDDSNETARMHPGCSIIPAALAAAQTAEASLGDVLDAIAVGYDVGAAVNLGTWPDRRTMRLSILSVHHIGGLFGSLAAVLRIRRARPDIARRALGYAVQHAGGCLSCLADPEHTEKAVTFGGLPARSALFSYELAELGFSTCADPFSGNESFFAAFGHESDLDIIRERLSQVGRAMNETSIKRYPIGMPIQAACQAIEELVGLGQTASPQSVLVELPTERVAIVNARAARDISLQYVLALQLTMGRVDFGALHGITPAPDAAVELAKRIELVGAPDLDIDVNGFGTTLVARVTLMESEQKRTTIVAWPKGTPRNPLGWDDMETKAVEVLGACDWTREAATRLIGYARTCNTSLSISDFIDTVVRDAKAKA